ncbi:MAG: hypothetical protein PF518_00365, partial [Spirochaetaceae bacterium]|nr:hypothetical protein [Spirochaetaceae bacterium]
MKIIIENDLLISKGNCYTWMWNLIDDRFKILDKKNRVISSGKLEPAITLSRKGHQIPYSPAEDINFKIEENTVRIFYKNDQLKTSTSIQWVFNENTIYINPINFESSENYDLVNIVYFAQRSEEKGGNQYKPSLYSRYLVTPGLSMSTSISPVVDLQSKFETMACLGSGAMRGPGLAQQWGLPSHYFCLFNTMDKWNSINAKNEISSAACWGIRDLPQGDFRLDIRKIAMSPVLNVRSDLWHHLSTPGKITAGFSFVITFGNHYHEAIRNYYRTLKDEKIILSTGIENSRIKTEVILSPQYNTWGVEIAKAMAPEDLTEKEVLSIYKKLKESPMKAETFVITFGNHYHEA